VSEDGSLDTSEDGGSELTFSIVLGELLRASKSFSHIQPERFAGATF